MTPTGQRADSQPRQIIEAGDLAPDLLREAIELNQQMEAIVRTNLREYEEQNMFVRPVVKRMFQQGTGLKVEDWLVLAQDMTRRLQSESANEHAGQPALDASRLETYLASVRRMVDYITKQEADARGWMRDPAQLNAALEALRQRKETVQQLAEVLAQIQQHSMASPVAGAGVNS